jgi:23S rRNA pseudouridine1911/1915/1917 synthase
MTDSDSIEFTADTAGERLDRLIVAHLGDQLTRSQIQALIRDGRVTVDGAATKVSAKIKGGETIRITQPPPPEDESVEAEPIELNIVHEDNEFAVIDKPAGLVVHPGAGNEDGTLVNALLNRYPEIATMNYDPRRRGIVHRLDKDTSGLILIGRTSTTMQALMQQFQARTVEKTYLALTENPPKTRIGRIDAPIIRDSNDRRRMMIRRGGKNAVSEFEVIENFTSGQALLRVKLLTGRTHQIRVHLKFIDAPIVGDKMYGRRKQRIPLKRQFLHAAELCFDHPRTGERLCFESVLPDELQAVLDELRAT